MTPFIITIFVLLAIVLVYVLMQTSSGKTSRNDYLQAMARFFEGQLSPVEEHENSFRIAFKYRGYECLYEDIEIPGLRKGTATYFAHLKVKTASKCNLTFSERSRTQIRSTVQNLDDMSNSRWGKMEGQVRLPPELGEFHAYTNDPEWANKFINDPKILKLFLPYKNRDHRGHPMISLQVVDGAVTLEFHAPGDLKPSVLILQHNVTATEQYLQELIVIAENLKMPES